MIDISRDKTLKKTLIEIDIAYMDKIHTEVNPKIRETFIPPLFDEYTLKITQKSGTFNFYRRNLILSDISFKNLSESEQNKMINSILNKQGLSKDSEELIYVKYISATEWTIIYFDGYTNKKQFAVEVAYGVDDNDKTYYYEIHRYSNRGTYEQVKQIADYCLSCVLSISYFMQHRSELIDYDRIEVGTLIKQQSTSTTKKQSNKGYSQKIKLKSRQKKYILTEEYVKNRKAYNKIKPCWYVRGYYQHFGRDKILKYIPPRINYRAEVKLKNKPNPQNNIYELIDSDD